jgi:hypothetical protein
MQAAYEAGLVVQTKPGRVPQFKRYLDEQEGRPVDDIWTDIPPVNSQADERIGYPTQKPLALLERIVKASSSPDDIVLDAFCGCGTALVAAVRHDRRWIGIDVSPTACRVMAARLRRDCKLTEGSDFFVRDLPHTEETLRKMPWGEFQNWGVIALGGVPNVSKVGDKGIDGKLYNVEAVSQEKGKDASAFDFMDEWYPVQVKQKDKAGRPDIDAFETAMRREKRDTGFFVAFGYSSDAITEIRRFQREEGKKIIAKTVQELLQEQVSLKWAMGMK